MDGVGIREMSSADRTAWIRMRRLLWPEETVPGHDAAIDGILDSKNAWAFVAEGTDGMPLGFAELSIRMAANGCESQPVPFLEGIWVEAPHRRQGIGRCLIAHIEALLRARGFDELGSDSSIENHGAHRARESWGFSETERVVYFRKPL